MQEIDYLLPSHALSLPMAARVYHTCVALSDGSILLMGGIVSDGSLKKDVWKTVDGGASWIMVTSSAGWTGKTFFQTNSLPLLLGIGAFIYAVAVFPSLMLV